MTGAENKGEEGGVSEDAEQDVNGRNNESVGEGGAAGAAGESIEEDDVRSDGGESPGHEAETIDRERGTRGAESAIPSDDAEQYFRGDFGGNGEGELLDGGGACGREVGKDVDGWGFWVRGQELPELDRERRGTGDDAGRGGRSRGFGGANVSSGQERDEEHAPNQDESGDDDQPPYEGAISGRYLLMTSPCG